MQFRIWITNFVRCAVGISDISLFVEVSASSENVAMELAVAKATAHRTNLGSGSGNGAYPGDGT
jgi:hypothetical protein